MSPITKLSTPWENFAPECFDAPVVSSMLTYGITNTDNQLAHLEIPH